MKTIPLVLNAVLIVAVAVLYYFQFSEGDSTDETENQLEKKGNYSIVYVNADSLLANYDFFKDAQKKLEEKGKKLEAEYQNRAQGLQNEVNDYQRTISNLTIGQAKAIEENLLKKQQNLRLYQESLTQELLKEESKVNKDLYDRVSYYLKEYSGNNGIELVVKYNQGSDVLFASDSLDVTRKIIEGLNKVYGAEGTESEVNTESDSAKVN